MAQVSLPDDDAEDQALMADIQRGDSAAYTRLTLKYRPRLWCLLPYELRGAFPPHQDHNGFDDVVQEFWIRILRKAHTYRQGTRVLPWLRQVLIHTTHDHFRRQQPWYKRIQDWWTYVSNSIAMESAHPDRTDESLRERLLSLLSDERDLQMMTMFLDGFSAAEIGAAHGLTANAVGVHMHRLRKRLRQESERDDEP